MLLLPACVRAARLQVIAAAGNLGWADQRIVAAVADYTQANLDKFDAGDYIHTARSAENTAL